MRLLRVGCAALLAIAAAYGATLDTIQAETGALLTPLHPEGWRNKALEGGGAVDAASPEEDLVYGDDVIPARTRPRNKRRRRKRLRQQRPLSPDDYDDIAEGAPPYRPRLRPRPRPRPAFDPDPADGRPRPVGRRRKPQPLRFHDTAQDDLTSVAEKPGPPFSDIDEEEDYIPSRRRPNGYVRKPDHFPDDDGIQGNKPQDEEIYLPRPKQPHLPEEHIVPPIHEESVKPHRTRKGPRRHPEIQYNLRPEEVFVPESNLEEMTKHEEGLPVINRHTSDNNEEFKQASGQKVHEHQLNSPQREHKFDEIHPAQSHDDRTWDNPKEKLIIPMHTEETHQSTRTSTAKEPTSKLQPAPQDESNIENVTTTSEFKDMPHYQHENTSQESYNGSTQYSQAKEAPVQTPKQEQPNLHSKPYLPRLENKPYVPRLEEIKPNSPPDVKPITVSLDELLKLKNITLEEVLKENEDRPTQKPHSTLQGPLRRLPSASEFFAKRKNNPQINTMINKEESRPPVNIISDVTQPPVRPRENRRKYGYLNDGSKPFGPNRFSIKEIITSSTSTTQAPSIKDMSTSTATTTTAQRRPMPLDMQESSVIDPLNEEATDDQQLTSHDRELAKQNLKNRISEANNSSKVHEFLQSNGIRLPPITVVLPRNKSTQEVTEVYHKGQVFDVELDYGDRPVHKKIPLGENSAAMPSKPRDEILDLLRTESGSARLARILEARNMTLAELIEHRERGASHQHLSDFFTQDSTDIPTAIPQDSINKIKNDNEKEISNGLSNIEDMFNVFKHSHDTLEQSRNEHHEPKVPTLISIVNPLIYSQNSFQDTKQVPTPQPDSNKRRDSRVLGIPSLNQNRPLPPAYHEPHNPFKYNSPYRTLPPRVRDGPDGLIIVDNIGQVQEVESNAVGSSYDTIAVDGEDIYKPKDFILDSESTASNVLPTAVKSAIIASSIIFGLALLVFLAIFVTCKWRQKRTRRRYANEVLSPKARSPILCETMQHDTRHTKRSLSPVLVNRGATYKKECNGQDSDTYVEPRRYYLWRTIRKTLRYK